MIKVFDMFAGYGGAEFALKKAGIEHECIGFSEIDKFAIQCFQQNHKGKCYGDCTKINTDELPDFDLLCGGFPCQDVSIAGKRDLTKGRTNLYREVLRIAEAKKPKYMLLENVKGLMSMGKERKLSDIIIEDLKKLGYGVAFKCLNSKDFGIPQSRARVWFVCKLGGWTFGEFKWPQEEKLTLFIKDILEEQVADKYYLSKEQTERLLNKSERNLKERFIDKEYSQTLCARDYKDPKVIIFNPYSDTIKSDGSCGTLGTGCGSTTNKTAQLLIQSIKTRDVSYAIDVAKQISIENDKPISLDLYHLRSGELCPLTTYIPQDFDVNRCLQAGEPKELLIQNNTIRKLTPKECFRLMGFLNDEINLDWISDSQQYKLAGNGWEIGIVTKIFKQMFKDD